MALFLENVENPDFSKEFISVLERKTESGTFVARQLEGIVKVARSDTILPYDFFPYFKLCAESYLDGLAAGLANGPGHELNYLYINGLDTGLEFRKERRDLKGANLNAYYKLEAKIRYLIHIFGKLLENPDIVELFEQNTQVRQTFQTGK